MAWAKIDDQLFSHPKIIKAGNEAMGVWLRALSYCVAHSTDGQIASSVLAGFAGEGRFAALTQRLVKAGLLDRIGRDNYALHDFLEYQPSAAEAKERKKEISEKRSAAGRIGGLRSVLSKSSKGSSKSGGRLPGGLLAEQLKQNSTPVPSPSNTDSAPQAKPEDDKAAETLFGADLLAELRKPIP